MKSIDLAVFEDESSIRDLISIVLEPSEYKVGVEAVSRREALDALAAIHAGELCIQGVLLDGNLDSEDKVSFGDARAIYSKMQELGLTMPVIGISSDKLAEHGVPVRQELDITKWGIVRDLVPTLDSLRLG
ncbi:hypothetical protein BH09PAT4_BH09PAT4_06970 [soil metagenome]